MKPKLIIIVGPTAVGKSEVALELAEAIGAEIVNADSQQVYRYMEIGTGKPSAAERARIAHHVVDVVDPDKDFNVAEYRRLAVDAIEAIRARGCNAIVCGGTGLYIRALTEGLFVGPARNDEVRSALDAQIRAHGLGALYARLQAIDPAAGSWIHPNDRQRIIRALEVFDTTGKPISAWHREHAFSDKPFETLKLGLDRPRAALYDLINRRCRRMIEEGLVEEVKHLVAMGYTLSLPALGSVGYRHAGLSISGAMPLDDAVSLMQRDTRHLAKRQLTWFRRDREIHWMHPDTQRADLVRRAADFVAH